MLNFLRKLTEPQIKHPTENWMASTLRYTPDLALLQEKEHWWIFICGEEMSKHHKDWLMDPEKPRYEAFTAKEDYILWRKYLGQKTVAIPLLADSIPYVKNMKLNNNCMYPAARLRGQLFKILPEHFIELDEYKENGVVFDRQRVDILIPYSSLDEDVNQKRHLKYLQAWMYVGKPDFWRLMGDSPLLVPSDPIRADKLGKMPMEHYYYFSTKDYSVNKVTGAPAIINGREQSENK